MNGFSDHFSTQSVDYGRFRPHYPGVLFDWLASRCARHELAWDCGTGNGQAALALASRFSRVVATDVSHAQLLQARRAANIHYWLAAAESSALADNSVDLITVAQAAHWFDQARFQDEVTRVARPGALIAIWTYGFLAVSPQVDEVTGHFYRNVVGPYWPPERVHVESGYRSLPFPFEELAAPQFQLHAEWRLDQLLGYLSTWSASERYKADRGHSPLAQWQQTFSAAWGTSSVRRVSWPLHMRVGRVN